MKESVATEHGEKMVAALIAVISTNKARLSEIDGAIGDGDHGINMAKGFALCGDRLAGKSLDWAAALDELSDSLMEGIGGSMGPLYGSLFLGMADNIRGKSILGVADIAAMLQAGLDRVADITPAQVGDKCLMDTLVPAVNAAQQAATTAASFNQMLTTLQQAAQRGCDSTVDLVAKIGRASRLGERSRGVPDAGATSCCLLLCTLASYISDVITDCGG